MKKTLLLPLLFAAGSTAFGQLYFGGGVGYYFAEADTSVSQLFGAGDPDLDDVAGVIANVGYKVPSNGWHFEFEFQFFEPSSSSSFQASGGQAAAITGTNLGNGQYGTRNDVTNYTLTANIYYDILATMETNWGIYVGGGLGSTYLNQDVTVTGPAGSVSDENHAWLFTYQVLGGISYQPLDHIRFDLAYRYTVPEDGNFTLFAQNVRVKNYEFQSIEFSATFLF